MLQSCENNGTGMRGVRERYMFCVRRMGERERERERKGEREREGGREKG
ncbi:hypothetical protein [Cylindrospermopsis raciborskii]|nr:hypothetical protein [Cylindrospermopsis raciborskii]MCZ2207977.1 hypothetical protein [Cylindrospermopsis raciborskii PAMP2011]